MDNSSYNSNALFQRTLSAASSPSSQTTTALQWQSLNKHIELSPKGTKQILFNVSGEIKRGEMVALMGPRLVVYFSLTFYLRHEFNMNIIDNS